MVYDSNPSLVIVIIVLVVVSKIGKDVTTVIIILLLPGTFLMLLAVILKVTLREQLEAVVGLVLTHSQPYSMVQVLEHPSPLLRFPSSHSML